MANDKGEILFRLGDELRDAWAETCRARKLGQSEMARGLVEWFVNQDPEVQLMIVGAQPVRPDLLAMVLKRTTKPLRLRTAAMKAQKGKTPL